MFIHQLLFTSIFFFVVQSSSITNSSKGQSPAIQNLPYDDYDLNDKKSNIEGSGGLANLDDYTDEDEDEQLSKVTQILITSTSTTTKQTTTIKQFSNEKKKDNDFDTNEFNEDYKDDLITDIDYNEITIKSTSIRSTTHSSSGVHQQTPIRTLFSFLTRPPIAAGVLAGLSIGILTSVILLICIVQRFHKRERTHSSYTTGLLYPNQYGYSKSPQEFYA